MNTHTTLFDETRSLLEKISCLSEKYMLCFKQQDFFSFSDIEKKSKQYKNEYYGFIAEFSTLSDALSANMAKVSSLLLEADRDMNIDSVETLQNVFQKYLSFEEELSTYTSVCEQELKKTDFSISVMFDAIKRLNISLAALYDSLS